MTAQQDQGSILPQIRSESKDKGNIKDISPIIDKLLSSTSKNMDFNQRNNVINSLENKFRVNKKQKIGNNSMTLQKNLLEGSSQNLKAYLADSSKESVP